MSQVTNQLTGRQIDESNAVMSAYHGGYIRRQNANVVNFIVDGQRTTDFVGESMELATDLTGRNYLRSKCLPLIDFPNYIGVSGAESHAARLYETMVLPFYTELPEVIKSELTAMTNFLLGKTGDSNLNGESVEFQPNNRSSLVDSNNLIDSVYASNFEDGDDVLKEYTTRGIHNVNCGTMYSYASKMYKVDNTYYIVPTPLIVRLAYGTTLGRSSVTIRRIKTQMENVFNVVNMDGASLPRTYFGMRRLVDIDTFRIPYGYSTRIVEFNERNDYIINNADWRVGFELEKEDRDALSNAHEHIVSSGETFLYRSSGEERKVEGQVISLPSGAIITIESDGSLDSYSGFESVTTIYDLMSAKDELLEDARSSNAFNEVVNAGVSRNCGGHITFSRKGLSTNELATKLMPFMGLIYAIESRRLTNRYTAMKSKSTLLGSGEKYSPINLKRNGAIEIRLFSGVQNAQHLINRVELLKQIALLIDEGKTTSYLHVNQILRDTTSGLAKAVASLVAEAEGVRMKALFFGTILENEGNVEDAKYGVFSKRMAKQVLQGYELLSDSVKQVSRSTYRKDYCAMS